MTSPRLVKDINPSGSGPSIWYPTSITQVGNIVFFVTDDSVNGYEL